MKTIRLVRTVLFFLTLIITSNHSLTAQSCNLLSGNVNLGGPSHDAGFQENNATNATAILSNGNLVIAWETRDDVDGDGNGGFFQVFNESGTEVTNVIMPYADINAAGTGDQGTSGPAVVALNTGFVIVWSSEDGPGDTGPVGDEQQDIYFRIYNNDGVAVNSTTRISVTSEEDKLSFVLPLNTGGFVVLTHIDEDETGNNDDYFVSAFDASGVSTSGGLINISGGAHDAAFQSIDQGSAMLDLGGGNFVVAWESRDDIDGDGNGGFFRIFNADGTAITGVVTPYADINSGGTGDQATPGPITMGLANGNFVIAWESQQGPGDIGPAADDMQDIYFRIYSSNGTAVTGTTKANSDNTADEEQLEGMIELTGGNFAMLYSRDEDDTGNKDDYFIRTFTATGIAAGNSFEISSGAHLDNFCTVNSNNRGLIALNNGNFAVGWAARDGSDGDESGAYYRVFNASGSAVSPVTFPYQDINPGGIGNQSSFGPILEALPNGFTMVWQSEQGPGDVGPAADDMQDVYHRVIDNDGIPICGTTKTNAGNDLEEEVLVVIDALANGNFVVVYKDDEDDTGNKDDYFFRVIGGAPVQILCPALGSASVSTSAVCINDAFDVSVTGLQNMAMVDNNEQDYGVRFVAFADATGNPYSGGNVLGTVPFGNLTNGGTTAMLSGISINMADPNLYIYAILDANPSDGACLPNAQSEIEVIALPTAAIDNQNNVSCNGSADGSLAASGGTSYLWSNGATGAENTSLPAGTYTVTVSNNIGCSATTTATITEPTVLLATTDLDANTCMGSSDGVVTVSGSGGTPGYTYLWSNGGTTTSLSGLSGGTYTATVTDANGCTATSSVTVTEFALPIVTTSVPDTAFAMNGVPPANINGGGTPVGGIYTDAYGEVDDDGNGMTFSFNASAIMNGLGLFNTITYTYTDANGCVNSSAEDIFLFDATVGIKDLKELGIEIFPNPTSGIINFKGNAIDRIEVIDVNGKSLQIETTATNTLDISDFPSGIYFLKINVEDQIVTARMIKE